MPSTTTEGLAPGPTRRAQRKITLADLHAHAAKQGGTCRATTYRNSKTPVEWSCGVAGHEPWRAPVKNVMGTQNSWCPACSHDRQRHTLAALRAHATRKGGACLATTYINANMPVKWSCGVAGHAHWSAAAAYVMGERGTWCPVCANDRLRHPLATLQAYAAKQGGTCLATRYRNVNTPV